jgi:hypothetical protein
MVLTALPGVERINQGTQRRTDSPCFLNGFALLPTHQTYSTAVEHSALKLMFAHELTHALPTPICAIVGPLNGYVPPAFQDTFGDLDKGCPDFTEQRVVLSHVPSPLAV